MLTRLWLKLGSGLGKLLLILIALGLTGWALACGWYAWQHRGPVSAQEEIPAGEAAMTQDVLQTAIKIVDQHRDNTRYLRDAHAKAHGCVKAEVEVLQHLDPALRQGVFAQPGKPSCACPMATPTRNLTACAMLGAWHLNCWTCPVLSLCRASKGAASRTL